MIRGPVSFSARQDFRTSLVACIGIGVALKLTLPTVRWIASTIRLELLLLRSKKKNTIAGEEGGDAETTSDITVSGLFVHPVKSMRSVFLSESTLDRKGLTDDRRFMVVHTLPLPRSQTQFKSGDPTHRFLSQRQCPSLATISATFATIGGRRALKLKQEYSASSIYIYLTGNESQGGPKRQQHLVEIWDDVVAVEDLGDEAAAFLQEIVDADAEFSAPIPGTTKPRKTRVRLVTEVPPSQALCLGRDTRSYVPGFAKTWTGGFLGKPTLTDGFPILIASEASLEALNEKLVENDQEPIEMSRFRPNIVVKGTKPFEEDTWKVIVIGDTVFAIVKGCPRCKQSCTNQTTGKVDSAMEPLKTMTTFRRSAGNQPKNGSVFFAQNAIPIGRLEGQKIRVGDTVRVLETGDPVFLD